MHNKINSYLNKYYNGLKSNEKVKQMAVLNIGRHYNT